MAHSTVYKAVARAAKKAGYELVKLYSYSKDETNINKRAVYEDGTSEQATWKRNNDRICTTICTDGEIWYRISEVGNRQTAGEETTGDSRNATDVFNMVHTPWPASAYGNDA